MNNFLEKTNFRSIIHKLRNYQISIYRYAILFAVLLASALFAPRIAQGNRISLVLYILIFGVILLICQIKWPILGLIAVLIGGIFVPFSMQGGINISQIGLVAIFGVWVLDFLFFKKERHIIQSRTNVPISLFILFSIISFLFGQYSWYTFAQNAPIEAQFGGLLLYVLSAIAFLLVPYILDNLFKLEVFTWIFLAISSIYIIARGIGFEAIELRFQDGFRAGSLFWVWIVALLAGQAIANRHLSFVKRILIGVMILITFYVALVKGFDWRSGWFPPLISLAVIFGVRYWHKVKYLAPLAIIPFYLIVTASIGQEDWSWVTRTEAWTIVLTIAQVSPILGMGFANYYWYTPLFPLRGFHARFNSHSQFVDLIAQTGIMGLLIFIWFFAEVTLLSFRLLSKVPEGFSKGYIYSALGGIAGTIVAAYLVDWVLPFVYNIGMEGFRASILAWIFMGGIVTIEQVIRKSEALN